LDAAARFLAAARGIAASGTDTVFVGGAAADTLPHLRLPGSLPQPDLAELMRGAKLIITNGGSTLLQAIACGRPCIAAPIADDQGERIRRCVAAGVAVPAPLEAGAIRGVALELLQDERARAGLEVRAASLGLADGVDVAVRALVNLLQS
jgi:UDP:flavonoid glycosyltransferase YjiC (YdhE family)